MQSSSADHERTFNGSPPQETKAADALGHGHESEPLLHYAALMSTFVTLSTATVAAMRRRNVPFPRRVPLGDLALLGLATNRISRLVTRDKVTRAIRAPFTDVVEGTPPDKVRERPRGVGDPRRAVGELLLCPRCVGMWASMALGCGYMLAPGVTRFVAGVLAAATVSDYVNEKRATRSGTGGAAG